MIPLPQDFLDFLKCLNEQRVDYLLIGGYAVVYHGYPRYTGDMDIWVARNDENAGRVVKAIEQFGFDVPASWRQMLAEPDSLLRMGVPPMRIELLTTIDGVDFEACRPNAVAETVAGVVVPVISLEDLKKNKTASGRAKDLADLENLP